jgi:hypothetical protein
MVGKRDLSIFDAIEELETEDRQADGKRRRKTQTDARRAVEVQHQTKIYHHLVESRILLQRAIKSQHSDEKLNDLETTTTTTSSASSSFRDSCNTLLESLLQARCSLWKQGNGILMEELSTQYHKIVNSSSNGKLNEALQEEYEEHREGWKDVLNSRHKSLRLHSGVTAKSQFKVLDSSFWQQVEASMEYEEIRDKDTRGNSQNGNNYVVDATVEFDDSKLYQQLLKDFVASSASAAIGGSAVAAERLRKSRTKNADKKDVDRRASKGRKVRYKEISKLVNFTFPLSRPVTSHLDQDAYFQSLFGGVAALGRGR